MTEMEQKPSCTWNERIDRLFFVLAREARQKGYPVAKAYQMAIDEMNRDLWGRNPEGRKW